MSPNLGRLGQYKLPCLRRALKGWSRQAPGGVRHVISEVCMDAVTDVMVERGKKAMGLCVQLGFNTYMRPSRN